MRKNLCVGILRETKNEERRAPLTPSDVKWLTGKGVEVEIECSKARIFKDEQYRKNGAKIVEKFRKASLLVGIKEPRIEDLYENKIYMIFSHTCKGQSYNMPLLRALLERRITLVDYERIVDAHNRRLVYFGRFAGICGMVDSLHYMGKRLQWEGIANPFTSIKPAFTYRSLKEVREAMAILDRRIQTRGFDRRIAPFIIGVTGHGNVSRGAQEILGTLAPIEIHPRDMLRFIRRQRRYRNRIYKIVFLREEKYRLRNGGGFYFEDYLNHPERFESNLDKYLQYLNMFIHTSYWDGRYPRLVTKQMIHKLARRKLFRLSFIGDLSCDINGSVEITYKTATFCNPVYTYNPKRRVYADGYRSKGITILAIDNLPSELPKDASVEFGSLIREYVYQIAAHGIKDITRHAALPAEIRRSVITEEGRLTEDFSYLKKYIRR